MSNHSAIRHSHGRHGGEPDHLVAQGTLLITANLVGAFFNAAYHVVMGRLLPPAEYAALVAMLGLVLVASTPMLALQTTIAHYLSLFQRDGDTRQILPFFRRWLHGVMGLAAVIAGLGFVFRTPIAAFWEGVGPTLAAATIATLALSLLMNVYYGFFQGIQAFGWLAWSPQAWGFTRLVGATFFAYTLARTALPAIVAQAMGVCAVLLLGMLAVSTHHFPPLGSHHRKPATGAAPYLLQAFLALGAFALMMNIDANLSAHYFGTDASALFAKAATIARTAIFLPMPLALALFPKVASTGALPPHAGRLLGRALLYAALLIALVACICWLLPGLPWIILYGPLADLADAGAPDALSLLRHMTFSSLSPADAVTAIALLRAMTLALVPLALAYLLLNFETAQRHFAAPLMLVPCAGLYLWLVHRHAAALGPMAIPRALFLASSLSLLLLLASTLRRFLRRPAPPAASPP